MKTIYSKNRPLETRIIRWIDENTILGDAKKEWRTLKSSVSYFYWEYVYGVIRFLRNLWAWRGILWNDRDWDFTYIYQVIAFKLRKQADSMEKHGLHTHKARDAKRMRTCAALMERACEDYLLNNPYHKKADEEFGKIQMTGTEADDGLTFECSFVREREMTEADEKREKLLRVLSMKYDKYMQHQDLEMFAEYFVKHSRSWWN